MGYPEKIDLIDCISLFDEIKKCKWKSELVDTFARYSSLSQKSGQFVFFFFAFNNLHQITPLILAAKSRINMEQQGRAKHRQRSNVCRKNCGKKMEVTGKDDTFIARKSSQDSRIVRTVRLF